MGKRKKSGRSAPAKKGKETLPTTFSCLFCNHEDSVNVKLDKKSGIGILTCKVCGQSYQTGINHLSAAVDVYADWVDACEAVAKGEAPGAEDEEMPSYQGTGRKERAEEEEDGFIVNDEVDGEAEYGDD